MLGSVNLSPQTQHFPARSHGIRNIANLVIGNCQHIANVRLHIRLIGQFLSNAVRGFVQDFSQQDRVTPLRHRRANSGKHHLKKPRDLAAFRRFHFFAC